VLFDIINEPCGISWEVWRNGGFVEEKDKKKTDEAAFLTDAEKKANQGFESPGMQKLVEVIRETGAKNVIIAGGLDWAYDLSGILEGYALEDKTGHGIMYSTHVYPWKKGWQKAFLNAAEKYPIFMGEVGADVKKMDFLPLEVQEDPATWVPDILAVIQKHRLNWTGWSFHSWATPVMLADWNYTPTPFWGQPAKDALAGKKFESDKLR
jgi:endoglucanase